MASVGVAPHIISKILNHVETDVTEIYNRYSYDTEKREALEKWKNKLASIVKIETDHPGYTDPDNGHILLDELAKKKKYY